MRHFFPCGKSMRFFLSFHDWCLHNQPVAFLFLVKDTVLLLPLIINVIPFVSICLVCYSQAKVLWSSCGAPVPSERYHPPVLDNQCNSFYLYQFVARRMMCCESLV